MAMKMMQQGSSKDSVWESVVEVTKVAQEKGSDPLLWAIQISSTMGSFGVSSPSIELAEVLVSYICWDNNLPTAWKFLERALMVNLVPPMLVLALLSTRVIPGRRSHPAAYRLYLELLKRHAFPLKHLIGGPNYEKVIKSVDGILHLSQIFGMNASEPGILLVEYIFATVWQLLDASLDDEGLLELTMEKESKWADIFKDMEIDNHYSYNEKKAEHYETLQSANTLIAIETIALFLQDKVTSKILYLGRRNLPTNWSDFIQRMEILGINSLALRKSRVISPDALMQLTSETGFVLPRHHKSNSLQNFYAPVAFGPLPSAGLYHEASHSGIWLPLDLVLEDAMDGYQVSPTSAVEMITSLVKVLQASDGTTWHDTFLGLWIAALLLVQRERDPIEGPMPRLDTRLCMLLSITTLAVADLIDEDANETFNEIEYFSTNHWKEKEVPGKRQKDLVSSLQMLGDYHGLLTPPQSVISAANQAAAKAIMFLSGISISSGYFESINMKDMPLNYSGSMHHLIVEACIARNLLDTSAYMWPGYVNGRINQIPHSMPSQVPGWSSFMKGAPLNSVMRKALVSTPASSLAELEKVYEVAIKGSDDEKISAATILCGASLIRGWNVQEHTVHFITSLLSPSVPVNHTGTESHLISCAPVLNVLLVGIGFVDCVQIFSLHGYVPHLAASLMPICEVFGSCVPNVSWTLTTGEEISAHAVFSNAFTLLLKLWRFNHPPLEHGFGEVPPVGSQLTPEYLLLIRNSDLLASGTIQRSRIKRGLSAVGTSASSQPMFLDSFPKLKVWYRQHLACIASTLSGLVPGTPVHQIVDSLLNMMFRKINRGGQSVTSGSSSSSGPISEDAAMRPQLPAWHILEAVPFVIDAALTACAHGRLSPRELATGLKELADFLPACLATVVSYFSAEVTRGIWKPVFMNGTDWPSPAANLSTVEEHIHRILAATGVDVPSLAAVESSPATLPLPLAAFVSLTITYKIDKASERFLSLLGPALESLAAGCPWPCMPIVASLWTQKAKRWSDFLIFSSSRTVFLQDNDAVVQLLKSCFSATLGLTATPLSRNGGVGALLGHGYISHFDDRISPVAPGILYLRVYRSIRDIMFIREEIVSLLMHSVRQIASSGLPKEVLEKLKKSKYGARYKQKSFSSPMTRVRVAASLAASLVWLSGGLALVQSLIVETLPSWFVSVHSSQEEADDPGGMTGMLGGYVLAYFTMLCGAFAWSVESSSPASKRHPKVLGIHMEFLASAIDGKISLGCDFATWRAYILGFVSLIVDCTPFWVHEVDTDVLKRLSKGLRKWKEEELALALLGVGGVATMGAAAEMIIESES